MKQGYNKRGCQSKSSAGTITWLNVWLKLVVRWLVGDVHAPGLLTLCVGFVFSFH